jgi:hypothetical protein
MGRPRELSTLHKHAADIVARTGTQQLAAKINKMEFMIGGWLRTRLWRSVAHVTVSPSANTPRKRICGAMNFNKWGHRGGNGSPVTSFYYCLTRGRQHYPRCKLIVAPCTSACASCDLIVTDCLSPRVTKLRLAVNVGPLATT